MQIKYMVKMRSLDMTDFKNENINNYVPINLKASTKWIFVE